MSTTMTEDLRTDYKDDVLMPSEHGKRTFNIVDNDGNIVIENVHFEDVSNYLQVGDEYGNDVINEQNTRINLLSKGTGLVFDSYQDYLDAYNDGDVPVGSMVYIKDADNQTITALQVTYNNSTVKSALDALVDGTAIKTHSTKTGSGSVVTDTIAENTQIDNAIETLLNNDKAIDTKATKGTAYPKIYFCSGMILSEKNGNAQGHGVATVVLFASGLAMITYEVMISQAGTSTTNYYWGISRDRLKAINSNIPTITAITGGINTWYQPPVTSGVFNNFNTTYNGYAGLCEQVGGEFWNFSRNYNGGGIGSFTSNAATLNSRMHGICFGTFTPT